METWRRKKRDLRTEDTDGDRKGQTKKSWGEAQWWSTCLLKALD